MDVLWTSRGRLTPIHQGAWRPSTHACDVVRLPTTPGRSRSALEPTTAACMFLKPLPTPLSLESRFPSRCRADGSGGVSSSSACFHPLSVPDIADVPFLCTTSHIVGLLRLVHACQHHPPGRTHRAASRDGSTPAQHHIDVKTLRALCAPFFGHPPHARKPSLHSLRQSIRILLQKDCLAFSQGWCSRRVHFVGSIMLYDIS